MHGWITLLWLLLILCSSWIRSCFVSQLAARHADFLFRGRIGSSSKVMQHVTWQKNARLWTLIAPCNFLDLNPIEHGRWLCWICRICFTLLVAAVGCTAESMALDACEKLPGSYWVTASLKSYDSSMLCLGCSCVYVLNFFFYSYANSVGKCWLLAAMLW